MLVGAHVSVAGGIVTAFDRAQEIGAEAIQVHPTPPQTWRRLKVDDETVAQFRARMAATSLDAFFLHAIYLINLATARPDQLAQSEGSLRHYLELANQLGARGVIFHAGSHKGLGFEAVLLQMAGAMRQALDEAPGPSLLLIENSAGAGNTVGGNFGEIRQMMEAVGDPRVKVCLDTAHAFTAGYDLTTQEGVDRMVEELDREVGFDQLAAVHVNDSKYPFGSNRDRHENIGLGYLGDDAFRMVLAQPRITAAPLLLEVPGLAGKGPDRPNIQRLRRLAGLAPLVP